jgi:serine/threonine protein kinase
MGEVFLGERNGELVAVKCIHPSLASDPEFRDRFRREVAVSSRVRSSTCAAYVDSDIAASTPWLATEYVPGLDIQQYVSANGPLPEQEAITLAVGLAEALRQIHAAGIVHRDLKPSNVILSPTGPKVIDFGIARAVEQTAFTRTGSSLGSPGWMAPEQIRGKEITQETDMFSWGALVAFAASGLPPFGAGPPESLMYKVLEEYPELSRVPVSLRNLCWRALSKDPVGRPSPDGALAELLGPTQSVNTEAAVTQRIDSTWVQINADPLAITPSPNRSKRKRKLLIPVAFCLVAGVILAGIVVATKKSSNQGVTADGSSTLEGSKAATTTSTTAPFVYKIQQTVPTPSGGETLPMPSTLPGYKQSSYDAPSSKIVRVFWGPGVTLGFDNGIPMSHCADGAWTVRWRSLNPDVTVIAYDVGYQFDPDNVTYKPDDIPPASLSGYMGLAYCRQPAFLFGEANNGSPANLVDVVLETVQWEATP